MLRTLVVGWIAGGTMIVLLALPSMMKARELNAGTDVPAPRSGASDAGLRRESWSSGDAGIIIPVTGVTAGDLRDSFSQARSGGRVHNAIDIMAPRGTPVVAAVDGPLRKFLASKAGGLTVYQFDTQGERVYYYAHLDRYANGIEEGQFVRQGTVVGYVGTTGNTRGTPHLHFSIGVLPPTKEWWKGESLNPYPLLLASRASSGG